jgi:hypothetical protein
MGRRSRRACRAVLVSAVVALVVSTFASPAGARFAPGEVSVRPTFVAFGAVPVGTDAPTEIIRVGNRTDQDVFVYAIGVSAGFSIEAVGCFAGPVPPGGSCPIELGAHPTRTGRINGEVRVQYCFPSDPLCPGALFGQIRLIDTPMRVTGR